MNHNIYSIQRIQDYIEDHLDGDLDLTTLANLVGYSTSYLSRIFRMHVGISLTEYVRSRRLTHSVSQLSNSDDNILDVALSSNYDSHEGFTRAFNKQFGLSPLKYRMTTPPIPLFLRHSIRDYYRFIEESEVTIIKDYNITVRKVKKAPRKLIYRNGIHAKEYFSYVSEVGSDTWGILLSVKEGIDEPLGLWLPISIRDDRISEYVQGVEVPLKYSGIIPRHMASLNLPEMTFLEFVGAPYEEDKMFEAIETVKKSMKDFDYISSGYKLSETLSVKYQHSPDQSIGYVEGIQVFPI